MTQTKDLDALIAEAQSRIHHGAAIRPGEALDVCNRLITEVQRLTKEIADRDAKLKAARDGIEKILWHRKPGPTASKYAVAVENIAKDTLQAISGGEA